MSYAARDAAYRAGGQLLVDASLQLAPGRVHALVGPNGAGKSTLLKLLAGDLLPASGRIELNGRPLQDWSPRERARRRAVLPQADTLRFAFTAGQVVELGRLPCPRHAPERERELVDQALAATGVLELRERKYPTLSGGERARVQFARVLAQVWEPLESSERYLLLDEPTASLDLVHQHDCLRSARRFAAEGLGVLVILHDPNLAMQYADDVTLLARGRVLASGAPEATLNVANLCALYGIEVGVHTLPGQSRPVIVAAPPRL